MACPYTVSRSNAAIASRTQCSTSLEGSSAHAAYSLATAINPDGSGGRGLCSLFGAKAKRGNGNCLSQSSVDGPGVLPALPENRYGPYASSGDANKGVEYPFIAGYDTADCAWKNVEPARGPSRGAVAKAVLLALS